MVGVLLLKLCHLRGRKRVVLLLLRQLVMMVLHGGSSGVGIIDIHGTIIVASS